MVDEKEFFREATLQTCCSLKVEKALFRSFEYIRQYIPADQMTLNFLDDQTGDLNIIASATRGDGVRCNIVIKLSQEEKQLFSDSAAVPNLFFLNESESLPIIKKHLDAFGNTDSSIMLLRLRIDGNVKGSILLRADGKDRFTKDHMQLFSLLENPWTIVIINNRQFRELEELKEMLVDDNRYLHKELQRLSGDEIIGSEKGLKTVLSLIKQVAPMNSPTLLLGETGVGKEVVATAIHEWSPRREGPFIKVNCGAIPDTLIDSELFGYEKGAFTGAVSQKRGRFERADGGTIFLDEIGELPLKAQVRLLRVLQEKTIERVGGSAPKEVDIRIVAATHRDLKEMVETGSFREDLYYRLNVFPVVIPPLRHRKTDIRDLAEYFVKKKSIDLGLYSPPSLAPGAIEKLMAYDWPGNVRELGNTVERALILSKGLFLDFPDLSRPTIVDKDIDIDDMSSESLNLDDIVFRHISKVMILTKGRIQGEKGAAELLGLKPGTLRHRMRKLGVPFGRKQTR